MFPFSKCAINRWTIYFFLPQEINNNFWPKPQWISMKLLTLYISIFDVTLFHSKYQPFFFISKAELILESCGKRVVTYLFILLQSRLSDLLHEKKGTEGPSRPGQVTAQVWEPYLVISSPRVQVHQHQLLTTPPTPPPNPCHDCCVQIHLTWGCMLNCLRMCLWSVLKQSGTVEREQSTGPVLLLTWYLDNHVNDICLHWYWLVVLNVMKVLTHVIPYHVMLSLGPFSLME